MSNLFNLNIRDVMRGLVMAALAGAALPLLAAVQTPGFNILAVDWHMVIVLAVNGAIVGFVSYIVKRFFSDTEGKVFGRI